MSRYARPKSHAVISATRLMLEILADRDTAGFADDVVLIGSDEPEDALRLHMERVIVGEDDPPTPYAQIMLAWVMRQVRWDVLNAPDPWQALADEEKKEYWEQ
jgi:hypothetical protein